MPNGAAPSSLARRSGDWCDDCVQLDRLTAGLQCRSVPAARGLCGTARPNPADKPRTNDQRSDRRTGRSGRLPGTFWSGWPDLNRRPLRPEARRIGRSRSDRAERGASHLRIRPGSVEPDRAEPRGVGSRNWLPGSGGPGHWLPMIFKIDEDSMALEVGDTVVVPARSPRRTGGESPVGQGFLAP